MGSWEGVGPGGGPISTTPVSAMSALMGASRVASRVVSTVVSSGAGSEGGTEGAGVGGGGAFWELLGLQRPVMVVVVVKALPVAVTCTDSVYSMVVSRCCPCIFKAWDKEYTAHRPARTKALAPWLIAAFLHNRGRDCTSPDKVSVINLFGELQLVNPRFPHKKKCFPA